MPFEDCNLELKNQGLYTLNKDLWGRMKFAPINDFFEINKKISSSSITMVSKIMILNLKLC